MCIRKFLFPFALIIFLSILLVDSSKATEFHHPGGMHTADQITAVKNRLSTEPWMSAYEMLIRTADGLLHVKPSPMEDFKVPFYYGQPEAHQEVKARLSNDAYAAYALALAWQFSDNEKRDAYADKSIEFIDPWATTNKKVSDVDGTLVFSYAGVNFLHAVDLLWNYEGWTPESRENFSYWVRNVYLPAVAGSKVKPNNHGAWGEFATLAASQFLEDADLISEGTELLKKRIADTIAENGELPLENLRNNSGMWYTYFALSPMTGSANIIRNSTGVDLFNYTAPNGRSLRLALDKLFEYCMAPETWPYLRKKGPEGDIQKLFHPSADEVKLPTPSDWPNNLYEAMAPVYGVKEWADWVSPYRPINFGRGWVFPTLMTISF